MPAPLPILLVPGLNCTPRLYAPQIPALWEFGPVTVADHRRDDSVEAIAARILAAAPPRFVLMGLSLGGYIAFAILRAAPERVLKLALLDTSARPDTPAQTERRRSHMELARTGRFAEIPELQFPLLVHTNRHGDGALKHIVVQMAQETGPEAFVRQQYAIMNRPDSRPGLAAVRCPTLVLVGDGDQLTPPDLAAEMHALMPASRLVTIPDCGHLSTIERPEAVNRTLAEWMRS
ncbi:alpha/beta fold hydrolase [Xanthobacteraceae bacterium Astr-EGSB]|uniref:alpha/beta fold hydrolase n=1 Tax=Astrobacterium formosum TaxID=3069710 RepID=UPI0027B68156|nr:alpha/beta fold hydrolase [Xanthobacteraceae bacterium Astr-EGSB]